MDLEINFECVSEYLKSNCDMFTINVHYVLEFLHHVAVTLVAKISKNLPAFIFKSLGCRQMVPQTQRRRRRNQGTVLATRDSEQGM
jgi:hypothetical protein